MNLKKMEMGKRKDRGDLGKIKEIHIRKLLFRTRQIYFGMYEEKLDEWDNFMQEVTSDVKETDEFNAKAME